MRLASLAWLLAASITTCCASYVSYPRSSIDVKSDHFSLKINGTYVNTTKYAEYDYVHISMDQGFPTEFRIAATQVSSISSYTITPARLPIQAKTWTNELVFTLKQAHYMIIQINGGKRFVIMVDPKEENVPQPRGNGIFNVLDYQSDNTGSVVTRGIQAAMDAAAASPGSIVYVPPGLYKIGNLMLRSRTSLYLAGGAHLRFTGIQSDYNTLYTKSDLGPGTWWIQTEVGSTDIRVFGRGIIDGNGLTTRNNKFMASMLVPVGTTNFRCDGILVRDSSFWAVMPVQSEGVYLVNLKVLNRFHATTTQNDGIDVCESRRVTVRRSIAIAKDDSFSTKTWPYKVGTTVPYPYQPQVVRDVVFEDCVAWTECFAYKIGEGVWENQHNVTFRDSVVHRAGVALGIHHKFGSAGVSRTTFDNIDVENLGGSPGGFASWLVVYVNNVNSGVGPIRQTVVNNIRVRVKGNRNGYLEGHNSSSTVSDVRLSRIFMGASTTPATSLSQMNILETDFSSNIRIENS